MITEALVVATAAAAVASVPYSRYAARHKRALGCGIGDRLQDSYDPPTRRGNNPPEVPEP